MRQHVRERDAELGQLRQVLAERNAQSAVVTPPPPASKTLTIFSAASVPEDFPPGSPFVKQADMLRRFARAQESVARRCPDRLRRRPDFIHSNLDGRSEVLASAAPRKTVPLSPTTLCTLLFQELLPAFDNLYCCVVALRSTLCSEWLDSLRDVTEWMFACFVGILTVRRAAAVSHRQAVHPAPARSQRDQEDATHPPGSVVEVVQVGFFLENKILRPARVVVVAARSVRSSS